MFVKTMALKITEKSYPVAVACLPAGFMNIAPKETFGNYLVINEVAVESSEDGVDKILRVGNGHYEAELFKETFEFVENELKTNFTEVRHR